MRRRSCKYQFIERAEINPADCIGRVLKLIASIISASAFVVATLNGDLGPPNFGLRGFVDGGAVENLTSRNSAR